jgi:hypothetical protein
MAILSSAYTPSTFKIDTGSGYTTYFDIQWMDVTGGTPTYSPYLNICDKATTNIIDIKYITGNNTSDYLTEKTNISGFHQKYIYDTATTDNVSYLNYPTGGTALFSDIPYTIYPACPTAYTQGLLVVDSKREKIRSRLQVVVKSRADEMREISPQEQVAMDTLREMISEADYRKYLKYGFVVVKGDSGDSYQIFRNRQHLKVWRKNVLVEEICVRIKDWGVPPTDKVIAFITMIRADEEEFKAMGNRYKMSQYAQAA